MLPLRNRLPLRTSRKVIESVAKPFHSTLFTFLVAETKSDPSRFAVILSKKISPKAVTRNLLRRQTLAAVQGNLAEIKPNFDVIILPKKNIINASFEQIQDDVLSLLKQAHLL